VKEEKTDQFCFHHFAIKIFPKFSQTPDEKNCMESKNLPVDSLSWRLQSFSRSMHRLCVYAYLLYGVQLIYAQAAQAIYLYLVFGFLLAFSKWRRRKERGFESHSRPLKKKFLCRALYLQNIFFANYCTLF